MAGEIRQDMLMNLVFNVAQFAEAANNVLAKFDDLDRGLRNVEKGTSFANRALSTFVGTLGVKVVEAATKAIGALKQGFDRLIGLIQGAVQESARIEVQWRNLSATAARMGVSFDEARKSIGELRASGIETSEALQVMTQWLAAGLPSDKLKELSRAAQDLAVQLGSNSTDAMERFNWFVQTGNSELLRTVGIMQTSTQMEERFAASVGKTREQLSDQERRLARVNGLLEATAIYAGSYERSMQDVGKRITSLPRLVSNVVEVIGATFVPLLGSFVDIVSDLLEKIESLFRVTKAESRETGRAIGEWKEGFLRLRAVVTVFANWFTSIWERLTSGFADRAEGMMDKFVNAIIRGVKAAADALRKFATFIAGIFGGRAPAEVTAEAVARTRPEARPAPAPAAPAPTPEAATIMAAPETAAKLRAKPVKPAAAEDISKLAEIQGQLVNLTNKLAEATARAAKARQALARAEKVLEKASQRVYDIRTKIQRLEILWSETPERFIRGRKRQLALELLAAEEEEREKKKAVDVERERLQLAEEYERQVSQMTEKLQREAERLSESIARQTEKYDEWLSKLQEAEQIRIVEPVQAVVDEFESLDDLTAGYLEEIQGELGPAFASIEASVLSIASSLGAAWTKAKGIAKDVWGFLLDVKDWFDGLPPWAQKLLKIGALVLGISWATGALGLITKGLGAALGAAGISVGTGGLLIASLSILATLIIENKEELAKWFDPRKPLSESWAGQSLIVGAQKALEWSPLNLLTGGDWGEWANENIIYPVTKYLLDSESDVAAAAETGVEKPMVETFERMSRSLVGASIIPDLVTQIVGYFDNMKLDMVAVLDDLTARVNVFERSLDGLAPRLKDISLFRSGDLKIIPINISNCQFGAGVSEHEIRDWMFNAIGDLV